jgi:hypothetical protein
VGVGVADGTVGVGVTVGVSGVFVGVDVLVGVFEAVGVAVLLDVGVLDGTVFVGVKVRVGVLDGTVFVAVGVLDGVKVMVRVGVMLGVLVLVRVLVWLGVLVAVFVGVNVGVETFIEPPVVHKSKVKDTLIVPYKGPVTLLNLPVNAFAVPAACAIGSGAAAHTLGEVNNWAEKIVVPLNTSCFRVWLGQPFAQEIFVWTR